MGDIYYADTLIAQLLDYLKKNSIVICLMASSKAIYSRIMKDGPEKRPLLSKPEPISSLKPSPISKSKASPDLSVGGGATQLAGDFLIVVKTVID